MAKRPRPIHRLTAAQFERRLSGIPKSLGARGPVNTTSALQELSSYA
jgi:hypothetical protein